MSDEPLPLLPREEWRPADRYPDLNGSSKGCVRVPGIGLVSLRPLPDGYVAVSQQCRDRGLAVPVDHTAAQIREMGFRVPDRIPDDSVLVECRHPILDKIPGHTGYVFMTAVGYAHKKAAEAEAKQQTEAEVAAMFTLAF